MFWKLYTEITDKTKCSEKRGNQFRGTLVDAALFGALFVLICDMIGRVGIYSYELRIELIVGIIGSVLFAGLVLYGLRHGRKGRGRGLCETGQKHMRLLILAAFVLPICAGCILKSPSCWHTYAEADRKGSSTIPSEKDVNC